MLSRMQKIISLKIMEKVIEYITGKVRQGYEWLKSKAKTISDKIQRWVERYKKYREALKHHREYIEEVLDSDVKYEPEQIDIELRDRLKLLLSKQENGEMLEYLKSLPFEKRKEYIEKVLLPLIASEMGVTAKFLGWFQDSSTVGCYNEQEQGIALNELFLASDNEYVLNFIINTIIHEYKHAMQWDAVLGRNTHGYSDKLIDCWRRNFNDYIQPHESDEGYAKQPVESDASFFAESVYSTDKKI